MSPSHPAAAMLHAADLVDQVGEEHGDLREPVGDHLLALLEPARDRRREDVEQQPLGALLLQCQRPAGPDRLPEQQHGSEQDGVPGDVAQDLERRLVGAKAW